uniref:hypothetical protein n=1 Tax=Gemmiger formicilis TaxID=745368 RepID=UPI0040278F98
MFPAYQPQTKPCFPAASNALVAFRGYKYLNNTGFSAASFFGPDNTLGVIVLIAVFALIALVDALLWALTQWLMTKRLNLA